MKSLPRAGVYGTTGRPFCECAQCRAPIVADTWSECVGERQVRSVWSCEACGYQLLSEGRPGRVTGELDWHGRGIPLTPERLARTDVPLAWVPNQDRSDKIVTR